MLGSKEIRNYKIHDQDTLTFSSAFNNIIIRGKTIPYYKILKLNISLNLMVILLFKLVKICFLKYL